MIYFTLEDLWDYYDLSLEDKIFLEHRDDNKFYKYLATKKIIDFIKNLKSKGEEPRDIAAYIGAYDISKREKNKFIIMSTSTNSPPTKINKILHDLSKPLGKIDEEGENTINKIGRCAEFRVINFLLNKHADINYIRFTRAFQFDGGKLVTIPYCSNCRKMFQKYPHLLKRDSESTDTEIEL